MSDLVGMMVSGGASAGFGATLTLAGGIAKSIGQAKALGHARDMEEMQIIADMQDRAASRGDSTEGKWIKRFIVLSIFGGITWFLWVNGLIGHLIDGDGVPATYIKETEGKSFLFGLWKSAPELHMVPITGMPVFDQMLGMAWLTVTFYFGRGSVK